MRQSDSPPPRRTTTTTSSSPRLVPLVLLGAAACGCFAMTTMTTTTRPSFALAFSSRRDGVSSSSRRIPRASITTTSPPATRALHRTWLYVDGASQESPSRPFATTSSKSTATTSSRRPPPREEDRRRREEGRRNDECDADVDDDECDEVVEVVDVVDVMHDEGVVAEDEEEEDVVERDPFEVWGKMRLGLGSGRGSTKSGMVFWVGSGTLHEAYTGKLIAIFEGYDVGRGMRLSQNTMRQISRKIFWFRDPKTMEVMTEYRGRPVMPIVYDAQVIDYHRDRDDDDGEEDGGANDDDATVGGRDDGGGGEKRRRGGYGSITYSVEASLRNLKGAIPRMKITSIDVGPNQMMINVPVFLDVPLPSTPPSSSSDGGDGEDVPPRRYRAWEFYDYNVDPSFPINRPPTAVWCRQGSVPPFFDVGDTNAVLRFSGHRVDTYEELPRRMRDEVERDYPHFVGPPTDLEEAMRQSDGSNR